MIVKSLKKDEIKLFHEMSTRVKALEVSIYSACIVISSSMPPPDALLTNRINSHKFKQKKKTWQQGCMVQKVSAIF